MSVPKPPQPDRCRVRHESTWLRPKSPAALLARALCSEFGQAPEAAARIAEASLDWMWEVGEVTPPGCARLSVPATSSRRYAAARRTLAQVTVIGPEDLDVWSEMGLAVLQRRRLVRWSYEIYRQGGMASLMELAAWANLTPTALEHRLAPLQIYGVWLPHVGAARPEPGQLPLDAWIARRCLEAGCATREMRALGITDALLRRALLRFAQVLDGVAPASGCSPLEREALADVARRTGGQARARQNLAGLLAQARMSASDAAPAAGFDGPRYLSWLGRTVEELRLRDLREGELVYFALAADQPDGVRLRSARVRPVHLDFFTADDAATVHAARHRVADLKFQRIERYAHDAAAQGALLSLPDLSLLCGMHSAAVRRKIIAHVGADVPTRGRVWRIGRRAKVRRQRGEVLQPS